MTNSALGKISSSNLPKKSNFKRHIGLDAITGKSNFDVGEYIVLRLLDTFQYANGPLALLLKNSIIRNLLLGQKLFNFRRGSSHKFNIDCKKEFSASVDASLLFCQLNSTPEYICKEFNFYHLAGERIEFGWLNDKFVSPIELYRESGEIDGNSPWEWRQVIKHDIAPIM